MTIMLFTKSNAKNKITVQQENKNKSDNKRSNNNNNNSNTNNNNKETRLISSQIHKITTYQDSIFIRMQAEAR